mgnify:FL=1|tara:strand:+ start:6668 stop:7267 length:600 start_codon:yes stop_codon:yes gene_type:complete
MALEVTKDIISFRNSVREVARPNQFQVELDFPAGLSPASPSKLAEFGTFLVKGANLPASTVGTVEVPYRGRVLKIAGDRTFEPWTVTVINDEGFKLRNAFEEWSDKISELAENRSFFSNATQYQTSAVVRQLSRSGGDIKSYKFEGIYPVNISAIDLAWDSNDAAEEYTVEFAVQYWQPFGDKNDIYNSVKVEKGGRGT